jgi:hypothetical protein
MITLRLMIIQKLNSKVTILSLAVVILTFAFCFLTLGAFAQNQQKGVSVMPSIAHIDLAYDTPEYNLTYSNNTNSSVTLNLSVKDFTQLEDSYKISFLTTNQAQNYKYSLSSWISFENKFLELAPKETKTVKIFIDKNRITKGGHYASILAEVNQPGNSKNVNLREVLSSLLFVRASTGKEIEEGKISSFEPQRDNIEYPDTFLLRFQNNGNVHVIPYGLLQIYDPFGNLIGKGILNENSLDALPESIRSYNITITTASKLLLPGNYTAKLNLHFGKTNQKLVTLVKYFSQGNFDFTKIGIGVILIVIVLLIYRKRKKKINKSE